VNTETVLFVTLAAVTLIPALGLIFLRDIVRAAFSLLMSFLGFAGLYALLGADFLAASQVLIYAGGILILLLFGVMLTRREPIQVRSGGRAFVVPGILSGLLVFLGSVYVVQNTKWAPAMGTVKETTSSIGRELMGRFVLPFEIASVALLVALVGAAYIARRDEGEA